MSLAMRWVENEMSMKLVVWGMKTWPLGMKYHAQGTKCLCLVWNESTAWNKKSFHKVWNFCIGLWKKFLRYENKNLKVRVWNWFLRVWKIFWQGMKLSYKGMKFFFKVWNFCIRVWKKFSFFWGYETIFEGMKKYLLGMKKIRFLQKNSFIP